MKFYKNKAYLIFIYPQQGDKIKIEKAIFYLIISILYLFITEIFEKEMQNTLKSSFTPNKGIN